MHGVCSQSRGSKGRHRRRACAGGFSLIELTMVLAIIAIVSAIAMPRFGDAIARYRVEHAARRVQADLILARDTATHRSRAITVTFVTGASASYTVDRLDDLDHRVGRGYRVDLSDEPYFASLGVDAGGDSSIVFDGFGIPDSAGTIRIGVGSYARLVQIDASTGEVRTSTP